MRRRLPLYPIAPLIVVVIGLATAATLVGLALTQIRRTSDREAQHRADVVATTMAARLRYTALEDRGPFIAQAAQGSGTELMLVTQDGQTVVNASLDDVSQSAVLDMLVSEAGVIETASGRQRYATRPLGPPLEHLSVVAFVAAPATPPETLDLAQAVAALTALLVGVAAAVTYAFARAAHDEVAYVRKRIADMANPESAVSGQPIPIRALDEVGVLTSAFNTLVDRFIAAEKSYRADTREAARTDSERLEFLAGLSHELRTPLNAILGFTHVLESGVDGPLTQDTRESLEVIRTSGEHLRTLIDDILDLSALETGELKLARRAVDVAGVAEEVVREARAVARHKPLDLYLDAERGVFANADKRRVRQILTNLVTNAVKFTPRGSVTVRIVQSGDGWVTIAVADTGYGIAESEREAIFEAYRQATSTHARQGGAGLGLTTVKRLVELHGGDIRVESAVGRGSTFTFRLPSATVEERIASEGRISAVSVPPAPTSDRGDT
ncbi:MAG: HAMP domain-containing sensor histidine kinase [Polyangiaceae bacterium]